MITSLATDGFTLVKYVYIIVNIIILASKTDAGFESFKNLPVERMLGVQWDVEKHAFLFKVCVPHLSNLQSVEFCQQ